jgi:hypothetical chaperone protein
MSPSLQGTLGIDFGTSNSAMAWAPAHGRARLIALEGEFVSIPTAVFYNSEDLSTHFGRDAVAQYLKGTEGRLMRSLKSLLGSSLLLETTLVNHRKISFQDIITTFLTTLRERATQALGAAPRHVVMGRPVHFVDDDPLRDALAQQALLQAAQALGFDEVSCQLEPIAAALDYERRLTHECTVLVADMGGGTSDFTVVRLGPARMARADRTADVLASTGVHIGGTDFDQKLSLEQVMPLLGYRHLGPQQREVPSRVYFDLSTWHLINWLYSQRALSQARVLRTNFSDQRLHQRLMKVLIHRHGHGIAHQLEQAKIHCSQADGDAVVDLSYVEAGLAARLSVADLREQLAGMLARTVACARECALRAGLNDGSIDAIYLTGGSSALRTFQQALQAEFAGVPVVEGDLFGGVALGLAYSGGLPGKNQPPSRTTRQEAMSKDTVPIVSAV